MAKTYVPVDLAVHQWPVGDTGAISGAFLGETEFAGALVQQPQEGSRPLRSVLILARGGTGKSKLAWSLEAQMCNRAPVFKVDLNTDVAAHAAEVPEPQNGIAWHLARKLIGQVVPDPDAVLQEKLDGRPWIVLLDSLDEVPLLQRTQLAGWIDGLVKRHAHARAVVFTRPPVFTSNYGLTTVDGKVEIPPLVCDDTDAALKREMPEQRDYDFFKDFTARYGLDRKVTLFDRCTYPHMATYRDLQVVVRLVRNHLYDKENPELREFQSSRQQVYSYFATAQLIKDMQGLATPVEVLALIDRIVASFNLQGGERNLAITLPRCVAATARNDSDKGAAAGSDPAKAQPMCERLLQSALFKQDDDKTTWHFTNQTVGDLFLSRWLAAEIAKDGGTDCAGLTARADLLESSEVAGFLVGQPAGQQCLLAIGQELCRRAGFARGVLEQLDQGLPSGPTRSRLLIQLQRDVEKAPNDLCLSSLLEGLMKTVPAESVKLPDEATPVAPPPEQPQRKAKKGKKGK
jgi:hypothetical protein